ncbi:uncharacterized protein BO80DRAFT_441716 [Aspergillus ibericus CBS 121593]|uniref:MFS general substrate transporter n=1 Tax=Aspergillus ibericus CBS 121593 TaxID=1448316 RepID=A0A395HD10_9EURO|nr:hypothetical protein BO80DRAFT_441716 [Aspergillus ibericus CBS 121593]RAL04868.1 hypothetical protein BO80DRAFT_441716 [Aspergillus ibericus CBS 121593]
MLSTVSSLVISRSFPQALAGGVFNTISQLVNSVGLALTAAIAASATVHHGHDDSASLLEACLLPGYRVAYWAMCTGIGLAYVASSLGFRRVGKQEGDRVGRPSPPETHGEERPSHGSLGPAWNPVVMLRIEYRREGEETVVWNMYIRSILRLGPTVLFQDTLALDTIAIWATGAIDLAPRKCFSQCSCAGWINVSTGLPSPLLNKGIFSRTEMNVANVGAEYSTFPSFEKRGKEEDYPGGAG